jgi:hypothetical protein
MGFYPPILFNSAITVKGLVLGWMVENFSMIKSKAATTSTD